MGKTIELYKGDSVTRVPEGSAAEAAYLEDGFTPKKPARAKKRAKRGSSSRKRSRTRDG